MKNRGIENQADGLGKRIEGKVDEVVGAVKGDTSQELGGKIKKNIGKAQQRIGEKQTKLEVERDRRDLS